MALYNTSLPDLARPIYGRHIASLIDGLLHIEKEEERQAYAQTIIKLMERIASQIDPDLDAHKKKVWADLFAIAGPSLKVSSPWVIQSKKEQKIHERMPYPHQKKKVPHRSCCGRYFDQVVQKVLKKEPGKEEIIKELLRWGRIFHKRESSAFLLKHLEQISGEKIAITPALQNFMERKTYPKKRTHRFSKKKKKYQVILEKNFYHCSA